MTGIPKPGSRLASSWDMEQRGRLGNNAGDLTPDVLSNPLRLDGVQKAFQQTVSPRTLFYVHPQQCSRTALQYTVTL